MKALDLPVLTIKTPLKEAFLAMKQSERSAVLATDYEGCWLFKAGWIVIGISNGVEILADLTQRHHVEQPSNRDIQEINWETPARSSSHIKTLLYKVQRSYIVSTPLPAAGKSARIIMFREPLSYDIGLGPSDCYCKKPPAGQDPHDYSRDDLPPDGRCYYDHSGITCYPP